MKIGVIGATGLVGSVMLKVLAERGFGNCELFAAASERSIGKTIYFNKKPIVVQSIESIIEIGVDIAIFSAGSATSLKYAPLFAEKGTFVIDNSSAWRMYDNIPLIVPQINADILTPADKIIANPNCSTIQMVMALNPLHKKYGIKRLVISTYQSVTGTGVKAIQQMMCERETKPCEKAYPYPIDMNVLPHGGTFEDNGYTTEETKLVNETRKILRDNTIQITATVVRVPVRGGHSEAVNIELHQDFELDDIFNLLHQSDGIIVEDNPTTNKYPMPLFAEGKDEVFVGRIRRDFSLENGLNMWIVADNLRKGAATNAIEIAQYIIQQQWIK